VGCRPNGRPGSAEIDEVVARWILIPWRTFLSRTLKEPFREVKHGCLMIDGSPTTLLNVGKCPDFDFSVLQEKLQHLTPNFKFEKNSYLTYLFGLNTFLPLPLKRLYLFVFRTSFRIVNDGSDFHAVV
jgi:hypothetical protein